MRGEQACFVNTIIKLLKEYNSGFKVYKNGSLVIIDSLNNEKFIFSEKVLNRLYEEVNNEH